MASSKPKADLSVQEILQFAVEQKASDVIITNKVPPTVRVDGALLPINVPPLNPEDTQRLPAHSEGIQ